MRRRVSLHNARRNERTVKRSQETARLGADENVQPALQLHAFRSSIASFQGEDAIPYMSSEIANRPSRQTQHLHRRKQRLRRTAIPTQASGSDTASPSPREAPLEDAPVDCDGWHVYSQAAIQSPTSTPALRTAHSSPSDSDWIDFSLMQVDMPSWPSKPEAAREDPLDNSDVETHPVIDEDMTDDGAISDQAAFRDFERAADAPLAGDSTSAPIVAGTMEHDSPRPQAAATDVVAPVITPERSASPVAHGDGFDDNSPRTSPVACSPLTSSPRDRLAGFFSRHFGQNYYQR